jgi:hypothetical protein
MILQPVTGAGASGSATNILDANCLSTDSVKDVVYISGDKGGGRYTVTKVNTAHAEAHRAIGIGVLIQKGVDPTLCKVQISGPLADLYTGLTPGRRLFVGTDSRLTETPPVPSTGSALLQKIGYALASNVVLVAPEEPSRLLAA